ncbi:hypothetical protein FDZ71_01745 [bacterium]|nr:MAG: hypothetical protein FDZ71_01745 [bacterium]
MDASSGSCSFTVNYPASAGQIFECSYRNLFHPSVNINKTGDELSKIGDSVSYEITVTNTSEVGPMSPPLYCTVTDAAVGLSQSFALPAGGVHYIALNDFVIPSEASDPFVNTADVACAYAAMGPVVASASDSHSINLFQPAIAIEKTGATLSTVGEVIPYEITVTNQSSADSPNLVCTVTDSLTGAVATGVSLASGESRLYSISRAVAALDPDPLVNTATVTCSPAGFPNVLTASDSHSINLFQPSVDVQKTGDAYSKVGDTIAYSVTITNTSSADTPTLALNYISDSLVSAIVPPSECANLAPGQSCSLTYDYVVQPSDDSGAKGATLTNTVAVSYGVTGFAKNVTDSDGHTATLVHPAFTLAKACADTLTPQAGPANYNVTIANTGDIDLVMAASEDLTQNFGPHSLIAAGTPFTVAEGASLSYTATLVGPFNGIETKSNTITVNATLPARYALSNSYEKEATGVCPIASRINLKKTTNGAVNPLVYWTFSLYAGPQQGNPPAFLGSALTSSSTGGDIDGILEFNGISLNPLATYTVCEIGAPAGWTSDWMADANYDGAVETAMTAFNPNAFSVPPEDLGNRCVDVGAGTPFPLTGGATAYFEVNNSEHGGQTRTPGYWKNWSTCSGGNQVAAAAKNGGVEAGWHLLDDLLPITWGSFVIDTCSEGRAVLDKRDVVSDKKKASDAAFNLATHLMAAQLNFAAGAGSCPQATQAAADAQALLIRLGFNGTGSYLVKSNAADYKLAQSLAATLDAYNNGMLCTRTPTPRTSSDDARAPRSGGSGGGGCFIMTIE